MAQDPHKEICRRIARLRSEVAGPRGKSTFAKELGLSPSTYDYYESSRIPPASVLVRIAEATGADLWWLLTGKTSRDRVVATDHPALRRAAELLSQHPDAAAPLAAFLEILTETLKFPAKPTTSPAASAHPSASGQDDLPRASWIPILGRSAAGVPQFWSEASDADGITTLQQLIDRHAARSAQSVRPALAQGPTGTADVTVSIVTLSEPDSDNVVEFVSAPEIRARHNDAFAVRIDGDSMSPDIRHGDIVILSPSATAIDGRSAVVQMENQIGVTCKIYRRSGDTVDLMPINEQVPAVSVDHSSVIWALRVLARVRSWPPSFGAGSSVIKLLRRE